MRVGWVATVTTVAILAASVALHWPWWVRVLVSLPAALAATCFLQASRNTCVARAMEGTFEHDDFSTTKAPREEVEASRRVAKTIQRDALLVGLAAAAVGYATTLI